MNLDWNFMAGGLGPSRGRAASCKPAVVYAGVPVPRGRIHSEQKV